jgi:nitrate reductase alpha subunit
VYGTQYATHSKYAQSSKTVRPKEGPAELRTLLDGDCCPRVTAGAQPLYARTSGAWRYQRMRLQGLHGVPSAAIGTAGVPPLTVHRGGPVKNVNGGVQAPA